MPKSPPSRRRGPRRSRPSSAETRTWVAREPLHRPLQDVGYNLHPDPAIRAAVGNDKPLGLMPDLVEDFDMMCDRIGVGLEQPSPDMPHVMRERQPVESRARAGIVDRRLLAEKVRRNDQSVAAGRACLSEAVEPLMNRKARRLGR
jgi:hypothetical protein